MLRSLLVPEAQLLFLCGGGPENDDAIRVLLRGDLDWAELCLIAEREQAVPVVWQRVRRVAPDRVAGIPAAQLQKMARVTHFKMSYLEQRLRSTVQALDAAGVDCVLLKGAALATTVYRSFADRPMLDVDMLIPADRVRDAVAALLSTGWVPRPDESWDGTLDRVHHHLPAFLDARGMEVSLELHTSLFPPGHPFGRFADTVIEDAAPISRSISSARVPQPVHMILHTCAHFAWSHLFRMGAWRSFRDIRTVLGNSNIDWDEFVELANATKMRTCCYWTFRLAGDLSGLEIPRAVLEALRPPLPEFLLERVARHLTLILLPSRAYCPPITARRVMWSIGIQPHWSGHGASRPWRPLIRRPPDAGRRASRTSLLGSGATPSSQYGWMKYWRSVLLDRSTQRSLIS